MEVIDPNSSKTNLLLVLVPIMFISFLIGVFNKENQIIAKTEIKTETALEDSQALAMMESVFVGEHSQEAIRAKVDKLLTTYKMEITEENYNKVGSMLVSLRKDGKYLNEMELVDCIIHAHERGFSEDLTENAGLCAIVLDEQ